jgi:uncharacterized protein (TIGR04255 family)
VAQPEFVRPPVIEMSLGVQFAPQPSLRPVELASLREAWRSAYPHAVEQPAIPPTIETVTPAPTAQFLFGAPSNRVWFLAADESELVQVQTDRLVVNWRQQPEAGPYPRFAAMRRTFVSRFREVADHVGGGDLGVTQVEINYVNRIAPARAVSEVLRGVAAPPVHGALASRMQAAWVYDLDGVGASPTRLYLSIAPGMSDAMPDDALFMTLTVRGAPLERSTAGTLDFLDRAHAALVGAFADVTSADRHEEWGRLR